MYVESTGPAAYAAALTSLLDNPERRARMAVAGERRVRQQLSWECQEPVLLDAYRTALCG